MNDDMPSYEDLTKYVHDLPKEIIEKLPDGIASRRAKQLIDTVYDYAKEAREQAKRPPALSVSDDGRLVWEGEDG
jgi:hypothetical protein